jgi:hypothetical protein
MKNSALTILLGTLLFLSCNNNRNNDNDKSQDSTVFELPESTKDSILDEVKISELTDVVEDVILFPATYRILNSTELKDKLASARWKEIHKKDGAYQIADALYSLSKINEDPCSGYPAQQLEANNNALLLFAIPNIQNGELDTVAFTASMIKPNSPFNFTFKDQHYKLEAYGIEFYADNGSNPKGDYTLKLFSDKYPKGLTLIHQTEYNDTSTELVMISDLDKDGLPDFIFSSPRDYEEERYLIILSSDNTTYIGDRQFDC